MGNYNLYRNTKLEQTWRNKKKVIHTFPKKCKKTLTLNISETGLDTPNFLGAFDRGMKSTRSDEV
jgi:hypothetical protein